MELSDIKGCVLRLTKDVEAVRIRAEAGNDPDMQALLSGLGGWHIISVLRTAAACAVARGLPADHPDVVLLRQALHGYGFPLV